MPHYMVCLRAVPLTRTHANIDDPKAWGYLPIGDQESFIPDSSLPDPPFRLFALGSGAKLDIPKELENIVEIQTDLSYSGE